MTADYRSSELWKYTLAPRENDPFEEPRSLLRSVYHTFWQQGVRLAAQISSDLPNLTLHDEDHLVALWDRASQLVGADYDINPVEAFVLGGAILLHDTGHALAAYSGGIDEIKSTVEYQDTLARLLHQNNNSIGTTVRNEQASPETIEQQIIFLTLRNLHAKQAEILATRKFGNSFLVDNLDLRESLSQIIGRIAASHNWDRSTFDEKLSPLQGAPGILPQEWCIRPVKLACLLRCADAIQIDERRTPAFAMAIHKPRGESRLHWIAQSLAQPIIKGDGSGPGSIIFTSQSDFSVDKADAWWIAYELIQTANRELQGCYQLMKDLGLPTFSVDRVAGAETPSRLEQYVRTDGWKPINAEVKISNVEYIVRLFGGIALYGNDPAVPLRELIQNASDAIRARRKISKAPFYEGRILVKLEINSTDGSGKLTIMDNGIGMSERVLIGPLIEFGKSFWNSEDLQSEFPGLLSAKLEQTGRYGIGFFSALMITNEIKVISKRFDASQGARSLTFREGLKLRPLLMDESNSSLDEFSTCVELKLNADVVSRLFICRSYPLPVGSIKINLKSLIAHLCPNLDCDVYTSENASVDLAHSKNWHEKEPLPWLRDILLADYISDDNIHRYLADAAPRLRVIAGHDGQPIGRACIGFGFVPGGAGAIGGLIEGQHARDILHFSERFVGCIGKTVDGPRRASGTFEGLEGALAGWASEQAKIPSILSESAALRYVAARNVAVFGGDPMPIAVILVNRQHKTVVDVFEMLAKGEAVYGIINHTSRGNAEAQLGQFMHQIRSSIHQSVGDDDLEFSGHVMEAWDKGQGIFYEYHKIPSDLSADRSSFLSCLHRLSIENGYFMSLETLDNYVIGKYKGENYKAHGLETDMELKALVVKIFLAAI